MERVRKDPMKLCLLALLVVPAALAATPVEYTLTNPSGQEILSFVTASWLSDATFEQRGKERIWTFQPAQLTRNPCTVAHDRPCVVEITDFGDQNGIRIAAIVTSFDGTTENLFTGFPHFHGPLNGLNDEAQFNFKWRARRTDRPVTVTPTPEPRTKALMFLGLPLLGASWIARSKRGFAARSSA